ncbi:MAG TPA: hypothetical protein PLW39_13570 [Thermoflexales bacterium]|nr:hypothetical protein [Thermoflexales bacterium]
MKGRFFAAIVLVGVLALGAIGIGGMSFRAGMANGFMQGQLAAQAAPQMADGAPAVPQTAPQYGAFGRGGMVAPYAPYAGYGMRGGMGFNPLGFIGRAIGFLFGLFFLMFILKMIFGFGMRRRMMMGGWGGPGGHHGPMGFGPKTDAEREEWMKNGPPWMREWHKRAHEQQADPAPKSE